MSNNSVLDLFSAAAGGWSLGMHRAGFETVAACEFVPWRRALYSQNNPKARMYDDVRTLTGERLLLDLGFLPRVVVGSPPCQDISPANTKGKGVEGERSGLYFEAVRIIGEVRPRWFALENSANLRTRGADAVLAALEALGYTCWAFVVSAGDIGANHERARSWIIGCDLDQVADAGRRDEWEQPRRRDGSDGASPVFDGLHDQECDTSKTIGPGHVCQHSIRWPWACDECDDAAYANEKRPKDGSLVGGMGGAEVTSFRCGDEPSANADAAQERQEGQSRGAWRRGKDQGPQHSFNDVPYTNNSSQPDFASDAEVGGSPGASDHVAELWADWNGGIAHHLRVDDGLSTWVAQSRIAVGGPRGTSASSLIVEAFGDSVLPQIPEAIGRAILRTEAALSAVYGAVQ